MRLEWISPGQALGGSSLGQFKPWAVQALANSGPGQFKPQPIQESPNELVGNDGALKAPARVVL
jgi:hypothetical protein